MSLAQVVGTAALGPTTSAAETEDLYAHLLRMRDEIVAGRHAFFKLPPAAIEQLKASQNVPDTLSAANGGTVHTNTQTHQSPHPKADGLPGIHAPTPPVVAPSGISAVAAKGAGLDPIFLQKSDSLVRAEGLLKRQRIERDLQAQVEKYRYTARDRDPIADGPTRLDVDEVLRAALISVTPISGLKPSKAASASSFDENDYYSSQAPNAFVADYERLDAAAHAPTSLEESSRSAHMRALPGSSLPLASKEHPHSHATQPENVHEIEDDDDEYTPPDAAAFDSFREDASPIDHQQDTAAEDDNSDYEPGEITNEVATSAQHDHAFHAGGLSQHVPVIRNHLTHIAAPQPNRVSPLATAKGPSIQLELVNGRPEVVHKPKPQQSQKRHSLRSHASTASPSANGAGGSGKKGRRAKKRKLLEREENHKPTKKPKRDIRREKQAMRAQTPPAHQEPYIKDEPVSPPPFATAPEPPAYGRQQYRPATAHIDLVSPRHVPQTGFTNEAPRPPVRYEYAQPASPTVVRLASPGDPRPMQRDTQDLRRVASLHYAQRPLSPTQRMYSPAQPYRAASTVQGEQRVYQLAPASISDENRAPRYQEVPAQSQVQYVRAPSPPRMPEYQEAYTRPQTPNMMPPPAARRIVVDQHGNRYYAAEPNPAPLRASVAPVERRLESQPAYVQRAPSRMSAVYAQQPSEARYEPAETRMSSASLSSRREEPPIEYVGASGYHTREYSVRPAEPARYAEAPTSPIYQQAPRYEPVPPPSNAPAAGERTSPAFQPAPRYEQMPPPMQAPPAPSERTSPIYRPVSRYEQMPPPMQAPPAPSERTSPLYRQMPRYEAMPPPQAPQARETTSSVYQAAPRAYSVRLEEAPQGVPAYGRQGSVAPVQYLRQDIAPPPLRPFSVVHGAEYGAPTPQQAAYGYAPPPPVSAVKYVDQYGREVFPQQVRQMSEFRY